MSGRTIPFLALFALLIHAAIARADEIRLKDGTKITGTIVGFENDSFRVETSYGFALVQKDKVADINISAAKKDPESKPSTPAATVPSIRPAVSPAVIEEALSRTSVPAVVNSSATDRLRAAANPFPAPVKNEPVPIRTLAAPAAPAPPVPPLPPPTPPEPILIRDEIRGNLYVNHTYGFQMYKPPTWQVIKNPQDQLPNAIGALGTEDQNTLLVVGRDPLSDSLEAMAAKRERTLRDVYENYRQIGKKQITVAGVPAVQQRFYGSLDGHDWSVTFTMLARGNDVFTILGMTSADSDLIQIQENVIAKTIASLQFLSPQ